VTFPIISSREIDLSEYKSGWISSSDTVCPMILAFSRPMNRSPQSPEIMNNPAAIRGTNAGVERLELGSTELLDSFVEEVG
jgi:hypothetical protein